MGRTLGRNVLLTSLSKAAKTVMKTDFDMNKKVFVIVFATLKI